MPLVRKLLIIGDSKGITLPKGWLDWCERELGYKITEVCIETEGRILKISPYVHKESVKNA